jgi:hypothetical protein
MVGISGYAEIAGPQLSFFPMDVSRVFDETFGMGLWVMPLTVECRDFKRILRFLIQFGLCAAEQTFATLSKNE